MTNKEVTVKPSFSFLHLLTLTFIVLKLTGVIGWSWFWVLSPTIFGLGLVIMLFLLVAWAVLK